MKLWVLLCVAVLMLSACTDDDDGGSNTSNKESTTVTTPSGLKYTDSEPGKGDAIKAGQTAVVHYTGWLDQNGSPGTKFDSSVDRGQPFEFPLGAGRVIKGWDEGVAGMKPGGKRRLFIPADLGYGARGAGGVIPPNAALIFDVELIQIK
jgi:peptidylprolyl isomerase